MNAKTWDIVLALAMLGVSLIVGYIFEKLRGCFRRRRSGPNSTDDGAQAAAATTFVASQEATTTYHAGIIFARLEARVTAEQPREEPAAATTFVASQEAIATYLAEIIFARQEATRFNNRVTAEQPQEEPATARQVEEASTLIPSDSATSSIATCSPSLQNHMPSREYADNPQSHFPLTNHSAAAATASVATTLEGTPTSLAENTAQLEAAITLFNNRVTAERPREEPVTARQVEEASTLIPSDSLTSSPATRSHSLQNHMPSREYADSVVLRNPQSHFPLTNHSAVAPTTSAATPEAIATPVANTSATVLEATTTVRNEEVTLEQPHNEVGHSLLHRRKPLIDDANIPVPASRHPQSPFPLTNRPNRSRWRKLELLLAVGVLLLVVNPGTASLKFWNVSRQTAMVDAATGVEPDVATLPVGSPAAPTSLHFNGVDGRGVVLPFPYPGKPTFVLSPEVQKVPRAYMETWFRAVESLLMMVCLRELDLQTVSLRPSPYCTVSALPDLVDDGAPPLLKQDMDSVKGNLFPTTCSGDHADCDSMNQIKMVLRGFSNAPRQTSKVDAAARGEPAAATPTVGLQVAPMSLHFDVGGQGLDLPFPSPGKPIFVLSPEVQEVSHAYIEIWFQAVESPSMMVCSYGSSNAWRGRFIGLGPGSFDLLFLSSYLLLPSLSTFRTTFLGLDNYTYLRNHSAYVNEIKIKKQENTCNILKIVASGTINRNC